MNHRVPNVKRVISIFQTWKMILIGTFERAEDLLAAIRSAGCYVDTTAVKLISGSLVLPPSPVAIELVNISPQELGFDVGGSRAEVYGAGLSRGLALVPAEVALQLRLKYVNQPRGEVMFPAMEPIVGKDGAGYVFKLQNIFGGCCLFSYDAEFRAARSRLIFTRNG